MQYVSTRGEAPVLGFEDVILSGLARDGGLYLPETWPQLSPETIAGFAGQPYAEVATQVIKPFVGDALSDEVLGQLTRDAYAGFNHPAITPLVQTAPGEFILELFHGPTLAFKDLAMQFLGHLFAHVLEKRGQRMTIVGATSGDTGGAAIEAMRGRKGIDVFMLHPKGRVSDVQRRMMTTATDANVFNIALEGNFDDCQAILKALFNDHAFRDRTNMGGVNSINWARVMAQAVYYFVAGVALGAPYRPVSFSVPTGNFGDIFAGYVARKMGLPINQLIIATNVNDILARTFATGVYETGMVIPTSSPSMDIQVSSNFERLLFEASGRDAPRVRAYMAGLSQSGRFEIEQSAQKKLHQGFAAERVGEDEISQTIKLEHQQAGYLLDPHTAVGLAASRKTSRAGQTPMICLSTAHPAKFPDAVERMSGVKPSLPPHLSGLFDREEKMTTLPNDVSRVRDFIDKKVLPA